MRSSTRPSPRSVRSLTAVAVAGALLLVGLVVPPAAAAVEIYSAPLRTAVQQLVVTAEDNAGYDRDAQFGSGWADVDGDWRRTTSRGRRQGG